MHAPPHTLLVYVDADALMPKLPATHGEAVADPTLPGHQYPPTEHKAGAALPPVQ